MIISNISNIILNNDYLVIFIKIKLIKQQNK